MNTGPARGAGVAAPLVGTATVQAAPTPADRPPTATQPLASRFAELLRRNRAERPTPIAPAVAHPAQVESPRTAATDDAAAIEASSAPANAAKARLAMTKAATGKSQVDDSDEGIAKSDGASPDDDSDGGERPATTAGPSETATSVSDPSRSSLVAPAALDALRHLASARSAAGEDATASADENGDANALAGAETKDNPAHARGVGSVDAANDRHAAPIDAGRAAALRIASDARFAGEPAEALRSFETPAATRAHDRAIDAIAASLGLGAPTPGGDPVSAATPSPALALATPIDAPDFAAALGVRVSMLVQDGVQRAELHLNPAETGPVSIHIALDGTAARVDFGADVAATRAAIERGLPELASALRDAGFTLAGGGVSQHAGGRASSDGDLERSASRVDGSAGVAAAAIVTDSRTVARSVRAGGVDLYA
jgi:flagellar hook-length control protein FliK